jgi:anthranilate synthase component I
VLWNLPIVEDWRCWPGAYPPEIILSGYCNPKSAFVTLVGCALAGQRGRWGIFALEPEIDVIPTHAESVRRVVDERPLDRLRIAALSYELGYFGAALTPPVQDKPLGWVFDCSSAVIVDHATKRYAVVGSKIPAELKSLLSKLRSNERIQTAKPPSGLWRTKVSDSEHEKRITKALEHIALGDIYQANISRPLVCDSEVDIYTALRRLYEINPVAHAAWVHTPQVKLLSNSMETLLTYNSNTKIGRSFPIKGTRGRSVDKLQEETLRETLISDPKERAEHVMIVDMVRNDLGKVCQAGSVQVPELMGAHAYRGVWHGVSTVEGRLADGQSPGALLHALFPGASITGAPKRRAMQVIFDLEKRPRSYYTGSIALITPSGDMSVSILIRTLIRTKDGLELSVGGGIVTDSVAAREIEETWEKAAVFQNLVTAS